MRKETQGYCGGIGKSCQLGKVEEKPSMMSERVEEMPGYPFIVFSIIAL